MRDSAQLGSIVSASPKLSITVIIAAKNEEANMARCLAALERAARVIVVDSHSTDGTGKVCREYGAEVLQFDYRGGYPKKRQWALDNVSIATDWVLLLDADELVPARLWAEIAQAIERPSKTVAYTITKGFHFLGRRMRYGGFSHSAVLLFRTGTSRFERIFDDGVDGFDMEVHERVLVDGKVAAISTPLVHEDFKGLEAYISRHNKYSTWEARLRHRYLSSGTYGEDTIRPRLFGRSQERRRALKALVVRMPFEHWLWFVYHYVVRLGFLEGRPGLIASQIRASYIAQVNAKMYELAVTQRRERIAIND
jgi:glycosyltransferase involved in cell wall biosynthesis